MLASQAPVGSIGPVPRFMTRSILSLLRVLLLLPLLALVGCRDQSRVLAVVLAVKGDASLGEASNARLAPGAEIAAPAAIRTGADAALVVSPLPGVMVRLESGGVLGIDRMEIHKRVDEINLRAADLQLRQGRARIWVEEFHHGTIELRLRTPAGEVIARGPVLAEIALGADGNTRAICVSGSLLIAGGLLSAGQWTEVSQGHNAPAPQTAADTDAVWRTLLEVRELEPQLLDLQSRQRDRTPSAAGGAPEKAAKN